MTNKKLMSYLVNVDVEMPKHMLEALTLHETYCVALDRQYVTEKEVKDFLAKRFTQKIANEFKTEYLFPKKED